MFSKPLVVLFVIHRVPRKEVDFVHILETAIISFDTTSDTRVTPR